MSGSITLSNNGCFSRAIQEDAGNSSFFANFLNDEVSLVNNLIEQNDELNIAGVELENFIIKDSLRDAINELNSSLILFNSISISSESVEEEQVSVMEIFENCRGFTKEEAELYEESLDELFEPTGKKFFDL